MSAGHDAPGCPDGVDREAFDLCLDSGGWAGRTHQARGGREGEFLRAPSRARYILQGTRHVLGGCSGTVCWVVGDGGGGMERWVGDGGRMHAGEWAGGGWGWLGKGMGSCRAPGRVLVAA